MVKLGARRIGSVVLTGLVTAAVAVPSCQPNLDDTVSIVTSTQVLAVQSSPAEAPPMTPVTYTALVAQGSGPDAGVPRLRWDYCNARNPLKNLGPVNTDCLTLGNASLSIIGSGLHATGAVPDMACADFGPDAPPATDAGPGGQPVDPDFTGGYYQPVTVFLPEAGKYYDTLYFMRLSCGFAGANEAAQGILTARYHLNENPAVLSLSSNGAAFVARSTGSTNPVTHGKALTLEVSWPTCPLTDVCGDGVCGPDETAMSCPKDCTNPRGCAGAERYVNFDLTSQTVVDQREGIHVSWYATAGSFANDRTGNAAADDSTTSQNAWTAPAAAGLVDMWIVLRDDRGGIGWAEYALEVE
jgi:hypothetical protein